MQTQQYFTSLQREKPVIHFSLFVEEERPPGIMRINCPFRVDIALISHASKVMLKILQARLQQYVNLEPPRCSSWFQKRQRNQRSNYQHPMDRQKSKIACISTASFLMVEYCSFLFIFYLSIHQLMGVCVVFIFCVLQIVLL